MWLLLMLLLFYIAICAYFVGVLLLITKNLRTGLVYIAIGHLVLGLLYLVILGLLWQYTGREISQQHGIATMIANTLLH